MTTRGRVHSLLDKALAERRTVLYSIGIWTTRDGKEIPVGRMTTIHLQNTLRLLRAWARKKRDRNTAYPGTEPRGEMAQEAYWHDFDQWLHYDLDEIAGTHPFFKHLMHELNTRRGGNYDRCVTTSSEVRRGN